MPSVRDPDKTLVGNVRKDKGAPVRKVAENFPKNQTQELCGWKFSIALDDNDLMSWMKSEHNGDNNRHKTNALFDAGQYRYSQNYCSAIENRPLFDRQSLHDRHRKHCQYVAKDQSPAQAAASVDCTPVTVAKWGGNGAKNAPSIVRSAREVESSSFSRAQAVDRTCFSAGASVYRDDDAVRKTAEEDGAEMKGDEECTGRTRVVSGGRSRSGTLLAADMTLPGSSLQHSAEYSMLPAGAVASFPSSAIDIVGDDPTEAEDGVFDEGYGSKVSCSDIDGPETEEPGCAKASEDAVVRVAELHGHASGTAAVGQPELRHLSHQETLARLTYSRREKPVNAGLADQHQPDGSGRLYAGQEQSRRAEERLSNVTPAYLGRYHPMAELANAALAGQQPQQNPDNHHPDQTASFPDGDGKLNGLQPRTLVLRKITIQDSGKDLMFTQNGKTIAEQPHCYSQTLCAENYGANNTKLVHLVSQSNDLNHRRHVVQISPASIHQVLTVSDSSRSDMDSVYITSAKARSSLSTPPSVSVTNEQDPASNCVTANSTVTMTTVSTLNVNGRSTPRPNPTRSAAHRGVGPVEAGDGHHPNPWALSQRRGSSAQTFSDSIDCLPANTFPMTDLLQAVERNIRIRRNAQRGVVGGAKTNLHPTVHRHSGFRPRQHHPHSQKQTRHDGHWEALAREKSHVMGGLGSGDGGIVYSSVPGKNPADDVRGFPAFKPYNNVSHLQRVKDISNRRIHGLITQLPNGSETVRVPSPRYAFRADQKNGNTSAKSASRLLGQINSRPTVGYRNSAL